MKPLRALWRGLRATAHVVRGLWIIRTEFGRLTPPQTERVVREWTRRMLLIMGVELVVHGTPPEQGPLLDEMERQLRRMTGVTVPREAWDWNAVPDHLKLTFRVVDDKYKKVAEGKDLEALKESLRGKVQETLSQVADDDIEQSGLTLWSFGELPQEYSQKRSGFEVKAYPTLVDQKDSVAIQLVESPVAQQQLMWAGQRRLVLLNVPSPIKYLQEKLPNKAKLGLYFNPFGKVAELIDDCIACGCDKLMEQHGGLAWDEAGFESLKEFVRAELNDAVVEVAKQVEAVLTLSHEIKKRLKGKMQLDTAFAMSDIQLQLGNLIHKGFVTETGWQRLPDLLRYLRAIERRLEKLAIDPNRDRVYMLKVHSVESEYKALLAKRDDLQATMALLKSSDLEVPLQFENFRD